MANELKLSYTPKGVAAMFLSRFNQVTPTDTDQFGKLLQNAFDNGLREALLRAKEEYRELEESSGCCNVLSQGDDCECFLCCIDRLLSRIPT